MILIDADVAAKEFMVLAKEPDYQHEGEEWRSGLYMAEEALYRLPAVDVVEQIFRDLEKAMQRSKTTHAGWDVFGTILEDYVEDMKEKYGVKEPQHNPVASGYYVEPKGEGIGGVPVAPTDTWNISGYKVEED